MDRFALLTIFGRDRPGIVASVSRVLYEAGSNIEDSSMTRLRGEFTILLILRLPAGCDCAYLQSKLETTLQEMELFCHLRELPPELALQTLERDEGDGCLIHVMGADKPGIVFRVSQLLQEEGGTITDLQTQVIGGADHPLYVMVIEAGLTGSLASLTDRMAGLARELGVEISVRATDTFTL